MEKTITIGTFTFVAKWYGDKIYIGKIKVAEHFYNCMRPKDDPKAYKATGYLPNGSKALGDFETSDECITPCEEFAKYFCKLLAESK